jgi:hypothetical protein
MDMRLFKKRKRGGLLPMLLQFTKQNHVKKKTRKKKLGNIDGEEQKKQGKVKQEEYLAW